MTADPQNPNATLDARRQISTLDAAGLYAERGLYVIPVHAPLGSDCTCPPNSGTRFDAETKTYGACKSPGKHPALDAWQTAASSELVILRNWFAPRPEQPAFNIGIVCGPSNIVVVDVDPRNGGAETFEQLVQELGPLPKTVAADSGGGGTHYVLRRPTGELESKLGKGVDLLRDGRQFLVEPSVHPSGGIYRWRTNCAPDETEIAALPDPWLRRVRRQPRRAASFTPTVSADARVERARKYLAKVAPAVSGDGGHTQMFNAVCIAIFGFDLDAGAARSVIEEYNLRCDPPFNERELDHKFRSALEQCKRERGYLLQANRTSNTSSTQSTSIYRGPVQSSIVVDPPDENPPDWLAELIVNKQNLPKKSYHNAEIFVRLHPDYYGQWSLNLMTGEPYFSGAPMPETHVHAIRSHADRALGFTPPVADIKAAILGAAEQRAFHPVRQYLDSIDWDGEPRLIHVARDFFGADAPLHAQMVRCWMIGAVARAMKPGCKLDTALLLHGEQGLRKSTFFAILGGRWHADTTFDISNKDAYQQIHAAWIYEFSELENVVSGRAESRIKAFITSTHDMFRAPYAAAVTSRPRSVALCGSTNRQEILTDDTGSRRFWIVPVKHEIDPTSVSAQRDQLWAEARAAYEAGEPWWFGRELEQEREVANRDFDAQDSWEDAIGEWLAKPSLTETSVGRVLEDALKIEPGKQDKASQMRVAKVLKKLGWRREQLGERTNRRWAYVRPSTQKGFGFQ